DREGAADPEPVHRRAQPALPARMDLPGGDGGRGAGAAGVGTGVGRAMIYPRPGGILGHGPSPTPRESPVSDPKLTDTAQQPVVPTAQVAPPDPVSVRVQVEIGSATHTGLTRPNYEDSFLV